MKRFLIPILCTAILFILGVSWLNDAQNASARQDIQDYRFAITLQQSPGESPQALMDDQIAMAKFLELLVDQGVVLSYQIFSGQNYILIQAPEYVRENFAEMPNVKAIEDVAAGHPLLQDTISMDSQPASINEDNGVISGYVTRSDTHAVLPGIRVRTWFRTQDGVLALLTTYTDTYGFFQFTGLRLTTHSLEFSDPNGNYVSKTYPDIILTINAPSKTDANIALDPSFSISGYVTKTGGSGLKDMTATGWKFEDGIWKIKESAVTDSSGYYTLKGLPGGPLKIGFTDWHYPKIYVTEYYINHDLKELATDIYPPTGLISVQMGGYGSITGAVTGQGGTTNMPGIQVDVWGDILTQWTHEISGTATTAANGTYTSSYLGTRDYRLRFSDPYGMYLTKYYATAPNFDSATNVPVQLGATTPNKNITLDLNPSAPITQTFSTGWYLVGWPVNLSNPAPETVFTPIESTLDIVWDYDACSPGSEWTYYNPDLPNTMPPIAPPQGYWVRHTGSASLTVQGQYSVDTTINLCTGWNLIGYPAARPRPVAEVLAPISGMYTLVYGYDGNDQADPWEKYDPAYSVGNDLTTLQPGRAYWIKMKQDATLTIPAR